MKNKKQIAVGIATLLAGMALGVAIMALLGCGNGPAHVIGGLLIESLLDPTEQGEDGVDGIDGEPGLDGADGDDGLPGDPGPVGPPGVSPPPQVIVIRPVVVLPEPVDDEDDPPHGNAWGSDGPHGNQTRP
jgi:hypothetical protein